MPQIFAHPLLICAADLTEPIDVYSEWIDRCEEENYGGGGQKEEDVDGGYGKETEGQEDDMPPASERHFLSEEESKGLKEGMDDDEGGLGSYEEHEEETE